jgi:heptosyltransferase-1
MAMMVSRDVPRIKEIAGVEKILLVRFYALGDIALSLPIVYALRNSFPDARISYLCFKKYSETLAGVTELDEVIETGPAIMNLAATALRLRREKFDLAIDLLSSPGSALLTRLSGARVTIGMDTRTRNPYFQYVISRSFYEKGKEIRCYGLRSNLMLAESLGIAAAGSDPPELETLRQGDYAIGFPAAGLGAGWVDDYLKSIGKAEEYLAGIVAGSKYRSKSWPEENIVELAGKVRDQLGLTPVILWGPGEEEIAERITKAVPEAVKPPALGIARLGAMVGRLSVLLGIDSGPKHLAVLQGVPTVTLFGPTNPVDWDPMEGIHRVITRSLQCSPCRDKDCSPNRCLLDIGPDEVISAAREVMALKDAGQASRSGEVEGWLISRKKDLDG